jgi:tetratricopeptide (TPR) repeat protein
MLKKLSLDQALIKAKTYINNGKFTEAQELYKSVLDDFPKNLRAKQGLIDLKKYKKNNHLENQSLTVINNLLNLYHQGKFLDVIKHARHISTKNSKLFEIWSIVGASAAQIGMLDEALKAFKEVILLKPDYAEAYSNLGNVLKDQGKLEGALKAFEKAIFLKPDFAEVFNNMGIVLHAQNQVGEAINSYKKAISLKPDYAESYNKLGLILKSEGKFDEALKAFKEVITLKPDSAEAYSNMGNVLKDQGKLEGALKAFEKAIFLKPDFAEAFNNMGIVHHAQNQVDEAINSYKKATSLKPDYAEAYSNMSSVLKDQGKLELAIEAVKKSISFKPNSSEGHLNLSFMLLNSGKIKEGLDEYEWRCKTARGLSRHRSFSQPLWNGKESLKDKRILLWSEQGIGDTINWVSCLLFVSSQAKNCILECQDKLIPLLKRSFPKIDVKSENRKLDKYRKDFDVHLPMGSLYKNFIKEILYNKKVETFLVPEPTRVNFWKKRLKSIGKGPYVGISWKSSNLTSERSQNYAPITAWYPLLRLPGITFLNLQYKDFSNDLGLIQSELGVKVHNFDDLDHYDNIDDVAAFCAALDMVVSTKVTPSLISAGVGTATKLLNWRQSSWNNILMNPRGPNIDIFERNTWETWDNVIDLVAEDILKLTKNWSCK